MRAKFLGKVVDTTGVLNIQTPAWITDCPPVLNILILSWIKSNQDKMRVHEHEIVERLI